jgi:Leucine-rich repeat (LRR) protein
MMPSPKIPTLVFSCVLMMLISYFGAVPSYSQTLPADSIPVDSLYRFADFDFFGRGGGEEGYGGSGEGEEEPTYEGSWQKIRKDGTPGKYHFFHGTEIEEEDLDNVKILEINSYNGGEIPHWIGKLKNLQVLEIDYANDKPLPKEIWSLPHIEVLKITYLNTTGGISPGIGRLEHLKFLFLQGLGYQEDQTAQQIPSSIGNLQELESLTIRGLKVDQIPKQIGNLKKLRSLDLSFQDMAEVPSQICQLTQLDTLILSENRLSNLPAAIGMLTHLKLLDLNSNALTTLPAEIGDLTQLATLHLENNQLSVLPAEITTLSNLTELDLRGNELATLPSEWAQMTQLATLDLSGNRLSDLPSQLGKLHALQTLDLSYNMLQSLPENMGEMANLRFLNAESNQLQTLAASIGDLKNLRWIKFKGNALTDLPSTIIALDNVDITWDRRGLLQVEPPIWAFINRRGFKIEKVPTEIAGKPLAHYLQLPSIDAFSKRYIQGDLGLENDSITLAILDSLLTDNLETAPFYLHLFTTLICTNQELATEAGEENGWLKVSWAKTKETNVTREKGALYMLKNPCTFLEQVKNGPYQAYYGRWIMNTSSEIGDEVYALHRKCSSRLIAETFRAQMNSDCQAQHKRDLFELVETIARDIQGIQRE